MKNTLNDMPFVLAPEYFNATHAYLYGDKYNGIHGDPWLDRTYEEKEFHTPIVQAFVFTWIIFLSFKQITIPLLILLLIFTYYIYFIRTCELCIWILNGYRKFLWWNCRI